MKTARLIPFCCGAGAKTPGCERGPSALKESGIPQKVNLEWYEDPDALYDTPWSKNAHKKLPELGKRERKDLVLWHCRHLRDQVEDAVRKGFLPITFGGDHSMAAASISGFAKAKNAHGKIGVLWIDAHADLNTPETTPSNALHGMPVAALMGMGDEDYAGLGGETVISPEHVCYMGVRDIDSGEQDYMTQLPMQHYSMKKIHDMGIDAAFEEALAYLAPKVDYLCLSFDIDSLDPSEGLATGTLVECGFEKTDLFPALANVLSKYSFDLFEIAEYNPTLDGKETTEAIIYELLDIFVSSSMSSNLDTTASIAK